MEKFFTWVDPVNGGSAQNAFLRRIEDSAFDCVTKTYGGWDSTVRPWWDHHLFKNWDHEFEWKPFVCQMKFEEGNTIVPQAPFCDVKNDKNCTIGCKPADNNPDCVINPNYVRPVP